MAASMNRAAKASVNDMAVGQIKASKDSAHLVESFTKWAEPSSKCDAHAFLACLHKNGNAHAYEVYYNFEGACAKQSDCVWSNTEYHTTEADGYKTRKAMRQVGAEVMQDVAQHMAHQ
jgi:hypothetical protein